MMDFIRFGRSLLSFALLCLLAVNSPAQNGGEVHLDVLRVGSRTLQMLSGSLDVSNRKQVTEFYLNVPKEQLLEASKKANDSTEKESSVFYVSGHQFRADIESNKMGKASMFFNTETAVMDVVRWDMGKFASWDVNQTRKDVAKSMEGMSNVPNMDEIVKSLPKDQQDKLKEAMEKAKESGYNIPNMDNIPGMATTAEKKVTDTGDERTINTFFCRRNLVEIGNKMKSVWVTKSNPKLTELYHRVSEEFKQSFQMGPDQSEDDIDALFPDAVPILERTFTYSPYGDVHLEIQEIKSAEIKTLPASTFDFSREKLQKVSIMELWGDQR